jgi:tetratricopeptide (TPR) repeat protein
MTFSSSKAIAFMKESERFRFGPRTCGLLCGSLTCGKRRVDFSAAIRLNSKVAAFYYARGNALRGNGDIDRAIADYSEAIRLDPKDGDFYESRSKAWYAKGDKERANADRGEAIRLRLRQ